MVWPSLRYLFLSISQGCFLSVSGDNCTLWNLCILTRQWTDGIKLSHYVWLCHRGPVGSTLLRLMFCASQIRFPRVIVIFRGPSTNHWVSPARLSERRGCCGSFGCRRMSSQVGDVWKRLPEGYLRPFKSESCYCQLLFWCWRTIWLYMP